MKTNALAAEFVEFTSLSNTKTPQGCLLLLLPVDRGRQTKQNLGGRTKKVQ